MSRVLSEGAVAITIDRHGKRTVLANVAHLADARGHSEEVLELLLSGDAQLFVGVVLVGRTRRAVLARIGEAGDEALAHLFGKWMARRASRARARGAGPRKRPQRRRRAVARSKRSTAS